MELGTRDPWSKLLAVALSYGRRSAYVLLWFWIKFDIWLVRGPQWMYARMLRSLAFPCHASWPSLTWTSTIIIKSVTWSLLMVGVGGLQRSPVSLVVSSLTGFLRSRFPPMGALTWGCGVILAALRFLLGISLRYAGHCRLEKSRLLGFRDWLSIPGSDSFFGRLHGINCLLALFLGIKVWRFRQTIRFVGWKMS